MATETDLSLVLSKTLDDIGYSQRMIKLRRQFWANIGSIQSDDDLCEVVAGSKAEGLTKYFESDIDQMNVHLNSVSTSNPEFYRNNGRLNVFKVDLTDTEPGYTRLILMKSGNRNCICGGVQTSLTEPIGGEVYLSSDSWRQYHWRNSSCTCRLFGIRDLPAQGPSNPFEVGGVNEDFVDAIICDCPAILQSWINRPRKYGWPSTADIQEVSSLEAHVVPIGFKGSFYQFLEWRICFTKAEIKLVHCFNDCQVKLLLLLKIIAKNSLKRVCKAMTTYLMKNIVLWMAEIFPKEYFSPENLFQLLKLALRFLRECVVAGCLPCYMIPERNLFVNKLDRRGRSGLSAKTRTCAMIDILLGEDMTMLLRCEQIRGAWDLQLSFPALFGLLKEIIDFIEIKFMSLFPNAVKISLFEDIFPQLVPLVDIVTHLFSYIKQSGILDEFMHLLRGVFPFI